MPVPRRPLASEIDADDTTGCARNAIIHQGRLDLGVELIVKPSFVIDLGQ
jgi:hypothetical protein